ncbi:hypothetical protein O9K51_01436 [Purpureocillium lavendulum]|uniref:Uncharacterized protein n=1 Tax=Purpureocillium lavendulum TaxID=1247861 RepID=A0AB34G5W4_9HYPO|nr:hypothetical protein O9K51_01436 [Purpureocillium lavendulum]
MVPSTAHGGHATGGGWKDKFGPEMKASVQPMLFVSRNQRRASEQTQPAQHHRWALCHSSQPTGLE